MQSADSVQKVKILLLDGLQSIRFVTVHGVTKLSVRTTVHTMDTITMCMLATGRTSL